MDAMKRTIIVLLFLVTGTNAQDLVGPTDPTRVGGKRAYTPVGQNYQKIVHTMSGPVIVSSGERFWMTLNVSFSPAIDAKVTHLSGAIYYDSTMVVPTGRAEALVGTLYPPKEITRGTQYGVDCTFDPTAFPDENLYEDAGTDSVQWLGTYPGSIESITAWSHIPRVEWAGEAAGDIARFEFMAISAGAAHITWSQARADCWEASLISTNTGNTHKPTGTVWKRTDQPTLFVVTLTDTVFSRTAYSPVYIYGPDAAPWQNHPGGYQIYTGLSGGGAAYVGQTIDVEIDLWAGPEIPANIWSVAVLWQANGLELVSAEARKKNWWNVWVGPSRSYLNLPVVDAVATTKISGVDSAAVAYINAQYIKPGHPMPEVGGRFIDLTFRVRQAGNWVVRLGLPQDVLPDVPQIPARVMLTTKDTALFPVEYYNGAWRTRWGSYGQVTITGR